eukprot:TRINITY_DN84517_c0_g1_i1.p1 TRINITY_DN84517_c0_g1~~TRINITY_DN84517_c0_g1_i1.p1  ORF type:complete len:215 (+),score=27.98 TRINITY_DN84517_c0_g1_i1:138-782(+)
MTDREFLCKEVHVATREDASSKATCSTGASDNMGSIRTVSECSMRPRVVSTLFVALALEPCSLMVSGPKSLRNKRRKHGRPSAAPRGVDGTGSKRNRVVWNDGLGSAGSNRFVPAELLRRPAVRMQRHCMLVDPSSRHDIVLSAMYQLSSKISASDFVLSHTRDLTGGLVEGLHGLEVWPSNVPRANVCLKGTIWDEPKPSKNHRAPSSHIISL